MLLERLDMIPHLWGEYGEGDQATEEAKRYPMCGKFAHTKVAANELQLA